MDPTQVPPSVKALPGHHIWWGIPLTQVVCIFRSRLPLDSIPCLIFVCLCVCAIHIYNVCSKYISPLKERSKGKGVGASLVAQWLGVHLPMQGTRVRALVQEDPTCRGAARPCAPQLLKPTRLEPMLRKKPLQCEARVLQRRPNTVKNKQIKN